MRWRGEEEACRVTSCLKSCLTFSEQVRDQAGQRLFQVKLQQLDGLQTVGFLFLWRPPTSDLEQRQVLTAPHPGEQLGKQETAERNRKQLQHLWRINTAEDKEALLSLPNLASYLVVGEETDALHLVEDRVVTGVDLVPPVNVSGKQEGVQTGTHQLPLVGGGVGAEHRLPARHTERLQVT